MALGEIPASAELTSWCRVWRGATWSPPNVFFLWDGVIIPAHFASEKGFSDQKKSPSHTEKATGPTKTRGGVWRASRKVTEITPTGPFEGDEVSHVQLESAILGLALGLNMLVNPTVSMAVTPNATAHLNGDLNPRFSLPDTTPRSSKTTLVIGGIQLYVYGLDELRYPNGLDGRIAVLHLAHMRTRTYAVTEAMAHEILHRCRSLDQSSRRMEVIAVTMDMRNHGSREVDAQANRTWKEGNEQHA